MMFNTDNITYSNDPFDHWILDDFLDVNDAKKLSSQFIDYDNPTEEIIHYKGWIGEKRTCNRWDRFPPLTYSTCLLYTSPSPRDATLSRMPSSA